MNSIGRASSITASSRGLVFAGACFTIGVGLGWAADDDGRFVTLAICTCLLAAANGYSKAYSP